MHVNGVELASRRSNKNDVILRIQNIQVTYKACNFLDQMLVA